MGPSIESDAVWLRFTEDGGWAAGSKLSLGVSLSAARFSIAWSRALRRSVAPLHIDLATLADRDEALAHLGPARIVAADLAAGAPGLQVRAEWALCLGRPLVLWRLLLTNRSSQSICVDRLGVLEASPERGRGVDVSWGAVDGLPVDTRMDIDPAFYSNGWQSWAYTGSLSRENTFPRTRLGPLTTPPRRNPGTPQPRRPGLFASDMYGVLVDRRSRAGLVIGFLSQRQAFGSLLADLQPQHPTVRMWTNQDGVLLDPGEQLISDWACLQPVDLRQRAPVAPYLDAVGRQNGARFWDPVPVGWCSWYYYFQNVTEADMLANLGWAAEHRRSAPLQWIQLDDGFEEEVGDWFGSRPTFPHGLLTLSGQVRQAGFRAGLWLAPLIAKPNARVLGEHPEWVLRDSGGRPVNAGFLWNTFARALDVTHPGVLEHIERLIETATGEWGYDYLKLDFLFAGALDGRRHNPRVTRAQGLHQALQRIRQAAGDETALLGCGCPLGAGIGIFEAMRIDADVAPRWNPAYFGLEAPFTAEPDFPSVRNALRNVLTRSDLHRRWWTNDPDCILLREPLKPGEPPEARAAASHLTVSEVQCLATVVALSAGSLFVSDHLPRLSPERVAWLSRLIPPLPEPARVVDLFDRAYPRLLHLPVQGPAGAWDLIAVVNWDDTASSDSVDLAALGLPAAAAYHVFDFWQEEYHRVDGSRLRIPSIAPHGVALFCVRPVEHQPSWVGDTLHISQGLAVRDWSVKSKAAVASLDAGHHAHGQAWLWVPGRPTAVRWRASRLAWDEPHPGVCRVALSVERQGELQVEWE